MVISTNRTIFIKQQNFNSKLTHGPLLDPLIVCKEGKWQSWNQNWSKHYAEDMVTLTPQLASFVYMFLWVWGGLIVAHIFPQLMVDENHGACWRDNIKGNLIPISDAECKPVLGSWNHAQCLGRWESRSLLKLCCRHSTMRKKKACFGREEGKEAWKKTKAFE